MAASGVSPLGGTVEMMFSTNSRGRSGHPLHRSRTHTELAWQPWKRETRSDAVARPRAGRGRTVCEQVSCEPAARVTSIRKYKTDNPIKNSPRTKRAGTCCLTRDMPLNATSRTAAALTTPLGETHTRAFHSPLVSSRPEQLAVRVHDLPLASRHLPRMANNPQAESTFSSSLFSSRF